MEASSKLEWVEGDYKEDKEDLNKEVLERQDSKENSSKMVCLV